MIPTQKIKLLQIVSHAVVAPPPSYFYDRTKVGISIGKSVRGYEEIREVICFLYEIALLLLLLLLLLAVLTLRLGRKRIRIRPTYVLLEFLSQMINYHKHK